MAKFLSGKRIQGTEAERIGLNSTAPAATSWKILGRTAVTSGDDIDVTVTAKDNMMVLQHLVPSGQVDQGMHFNDDGGSGGSSNYAWRIRRGGSVTGQGINTYRLNTEELYPNTAFEVFNMQHTNGQEKLLQWNVCQANSAGAGTAPDRNEGVGKWANTGNVTKVSFTNIDSGSYADGSEVVVLGCDNDEADSGTNAWQLLASATASGSSVTLDSGTFTAKKYLMVQCYGTTGGSNMDNIGYRVNSDSGSTYARRVSHNGGSDSTSTSQSYIRFGAGSAAANDIFVNTFIINKSDKEKLFISHCNRNRSTGSGSAPDRFENSSKWANTSSQITSIQLINDANNWTTDSIIKVWGFD